MIQKFLEYIKVEKRYAENTLISYEKDLQDFRVFLLEKESLSDIRKADKKMIRNFMIVNSQKGLSKRTINRKISALKSFYHFLLKVSEISSSPIEGISTLKFYPEKQIPFSVEEMNDLKKRMENADLLDKLIIEILYQTGIRRAELCDLLIKNILFSQNEIRVIGKGNKERIVPISTKMSVELLEYLENYRPNSEEKNLFFLKPNGKKITEKFVYSLVNRYLSLVSLKSKKSPHILRHSFATHTLDQGAEISKIKKIMGHSSLASTQVYTNASIHQLKNVLNNTHPRAKTQIKKDQK